MEGEQLEYYKQFIYYNRIHIKPLWKWTAAKDLEEFFSKFGSIYKTYVTAKKKRKKFIEGYVIFNET